MTNLVLTVVGDDRPGLVRAIAAAVAEQGGNWLTSDMANLAGKFAGIVLVDVPEERAQLLVDALDALDVVDVSVTRADGARPPASEADRWALTVVGNDRPGIVRDLTAALASREVSIEDLETVTREAPMSGGQLFEATAELVAPAGLDRAEVAAALESIAQELMVDVELTAEDAAGTRGDA